MTTFHPSPLCTRAFAGLETAPRGVDFGTAGLGNEGPEADRAPYFIASSLCPLGCGSRA